MVASGAAMERVWLRCGVATSLCCCSGRAWI
jgi:hypothetical protein